MQIERIEKFSDKAILVAIITLVLVFSLPVSQWFTDGDSFEIHLIPHLAIFLFSMLMIFVFWLAHARILTCGKEASPRCKAISMLYFCSIILLPFLAIYMSANAWSPIGVFLFSCNLLITAVLHFALFHSFFRHNFKKHHTLTKPLHYSLKQILSIGPCCYIIAASLCFVNLYLSFLILTAGMIFYAVVLQRRKKLLSP